MWGEWPLGRGAPCSLGCSAARGLAVAELEGGAHTKYNFQFHDNKNCNRPVISFDATVLQQLTILYPFVHHNRKIGGGYDALSDESIKGTQGSINWSQLSQGRGLKVMSARD